MRRERVCLIERCLAPQNALTPLHKAAVNGYVAEVEQLLVAEADKEAKDVVSGQRGGGCQMRM